MKYITLFILITTIYSCTNKECQIAGGNYEFIIPVTLTPAKDTFNIGDTITIRSQFSNMVYERITEKNYFLDNIRFYPNSSVIRIDTINQIDDFSEFNVIIDSSFELFFFNYSDGGRNLTGEYNYEDDEYLLEYKIIPREKGLFLFNQASLVESLGESQDFTDKCRNVDLNVAMALNDNSNNNVDFLLNSPSEAYIRIWNKKDSKFFDAGGYCFYVK